MPDSSHSSSVTSAKDLPAQVDPVRPLRILLVEDHADTACAIQKLLQVSGYDVKVADTMAAACQVASEGIVDVVICDIGLPDGTGLDLMRRLRHRHNLKGICMSGYASDQDIEESKAAGFAAHLTKPVNIEKLESLIPQIL
jgi:CheY-like chemotaxis protein